MFGIEREKQLSFKITINRKNINKVKKSEPIMSLNLSDDDLNSTGLNSRKLNQGNRFPAFLNKLGQKS